MEAVFNLQIHALNSELIEKLKKLFAKDAVVEIRVKDTVADETSYLLSTEENRKSLERSIEQLNSNQVINKTIEELTK